MPNQHAGKQVTVRLDADELERWTALKGRHGGAKPAFLAAIAAAEGRNDVDLPAALRRAADDIERRQRTESATDDSTKSVDNAPPARTPAASRFARKPTSGDASS